VTVESFALLALLSAAAAPQSWPLQTTQQMGEVGPADPARLPVGRAHDRGPDGVMKRPDATPRLVAAGPGHWRVLGWRMAAAPTGQHPVEGWLPAVVPGTALTTLLANQRYPDPAYGLNNLLIPETLARQDYWYQTLLTLPAQARGRFASLVFEGVNYAAEVRLDGQPLGDLKGAFRRGRFGLPESVADGRPHRLEVRVSPPPHPGFPQEQTLKDGPGNNGGQLTVDGPTFVATEGWDWIPGVRDRNTGLWQDVMLTVSGPLRIGDVDVRTTLPGADNSVANIDIEVPIVNQTAGSQRVVVRAAFDDVVVNKTIVAAPGETTVRFGADEFVALHVVRPRLWWPNGYGEPFLHALRVTVTTPAGSSDVRSIRFGMREVAYELTLNRAGVPHRFLYRPSLAAGRRLIATDHSNLRPVDGGWAPTWIDAGPGGALIDQPETSLAPHLVIRVNHVPIAVRGGNWGMDDWLKRVERARLEPFFRLHRDANLNTIRNWVGQSTEEAFYALADQYGLMVLNDFWISTQDWNGEPADAALFLANAADVVGRYRHHPSIVLWLGRNEGVPPPAINTGLEEIIRTVDGTRYYTPNSRLINMANSGPWDYQPPELYFTKLAQGFSTEIGTPSFPTLEAFTAFVPAADRWPVSDTWAYHDWHQAGGGDVAPFMAAMQRRLGAPTSLADFERKAQLLEYEAHRAIFEGMNAGLFTRNSGRLLWMSQPAWPSTHWQMLSHDYDTHGAFWGVARGAEPIHVQIAADTGAVQVVNSLPHELTHLALDIVAVDLDGRPLIQRSLQLDAPALATIDVLPELLPRADIDQHGAMIALTLSGASGAISRNAYWKSADVGHGETVLANMPMAVVTATLGKSGEALHATLLNHSSVPALLVKLTVRSVDGRRVLPVYLSDNYISLLPRERRDVTIACANACPSLTLGIRGWNVRSSDGEVQH